ncbi:MAG: response regulator transcription factor [Deltaproteobacteria bacterium]|nr:response regulator transcription factor [Deltaproteobacteria bacterium]
MAQRILIVEDEAPILTGLETLFRHHGYEVVTARDGREALERWTAGTFDLVVLDVMLPVLGGFEVLSQMRGSGDATPVLILTARGAETDVVEGLERGADDYVTKPFGVHELAARVKGLLRRIPRSAEAPARLRVGPVDLDLDGLTAGAGDLRVELTAREGALVEFLLVRRHRAVGRDELLVGVWGYRDGRIETRTVDVHVQKLRRKLASLPGGDGWIATVRGRGYRFAAEVV